VKASLVPSQGFGDFTLPGVRMARIHRPVDRLVHAFDPILIEHATKTDDAVFVELFYIAFTDVVERLTVHRFLPPRYADD
jgi:hypothetical protein